jgi:hypothetical protein
MRTVFETGFPSALMRPMGRFGPPSFRGIPWIRGTLAQRRRSLILAVTLEDPMSTGKGDVVHVRIISNDKGSLPGKLADAELIFEADAGCHSRKLGSC